METHNRIIWGIGEKPAFSDKVNVLGFPIRQSVALLRPLGDAEFFGDRQTDLSDDRLFKIYKSYTAKYEQGLADDLRSLASSLARVIQVLRTEA